MRRLVVLICAMGCGRLGFTAPQAADGALALDAGDALALDAGDAAVPGADAPAAIAITHAGQWASASQLSRTLATSTSRSVFTLATWYRSTAQNQMVMCAGVTAQRQSFVWASQNDGTVLFQHQEGSSSWATIPDAQPWPYLGTWIHLVLSVDLTQADVAQRVRWWIDGVAQTTHTGGAPDWVQGQQLYLGDTVLHTIGNKFDGAFDWSGALAETYVIWGRALDPSYFIVGTGAATRSIAYTGPVTPESVHFDYAVAGANGFAGEPDWTATQITTVTTGLPY